MEYRVIFSCDVFDETSQSCEPPHNQNNLTLSVYTLEYYLICTCSSSGRSPNDSALGPSDKTNQNPLAGIELSPNPFQNYVSINLSLEQDADLQVEIFDVLGKKLNIQVTPRYKEQLNPV